MTAKSRKPTPASMPARKAAPASMPARKATPAAKATPARKTATAPAPAKVTRPRIERPTLDWSNMPAVEEVQYTRVTGTRFDVEKEIPEFIRKAVEESFAGYDAAANAGKGSVKRLNFNAPTAVHAAEFARLAAKYGRYRTDADGNPSALTVRCTNLSPTRVQYYAKPGEVRVRKQA